MKIPNNDKITVFIDVDDTITHNGGKSFIPGSIEVIKKLSEKVNVILWSQGGYEYVSEVVKAAGLEDYICFSIAKPDIVIDDISATSRWIRRHLWPSWKDIDAFCDLLKGNWVDDVDIL